MQINPQFGSVYQVSVGVKGLPGTYVNGSMEVAQDYFAKATGYADAISFSSYSGGHTLLAVNDAEGDHATEYLTAKTKRFYQDNDAAEDFFVETLQRLGNIAKPLKVLIDVQLPASFDKLKKTV